MALPSSHEHAKLVIVSYYPLSRGNPESDLDLPGSGNRGRDFGNEIVWIKSSLNIFLLACSVARAKMIRSS